MTCTFFGHRDAPKEIEPTLRSTLLELIVNNGVDLFYVGNQGGFDAMVCRVLQELSADYSFQFYVVLAYMPLKERAVSWANSSLTLFPEGIETVPKRFAITYRNKWMIRQSDFVVTYVTHDIGSGAAQFKRMAEKSNKTVVNIS